MYVVLCYYKDTDIDLLRSTHFSGRAAKRALRKEIARHPESDLRVEQRSIKVPAGSRRQLVIQVIIWLLVLAAIVAWMIFTVGIITA